ncbi:3-deoxy-D-manno-octulosonic acid transferase [Lacinutrix sp. Bg11-31]|uniref:3-deoxy-D-manno-octulosonic acid transferase n=1 Tax=Lacinutrix sp. Bg11-31 TaxID=2057808 RepID=UPI000C304659|nr:glycosyltransferase N-terminal domain-containing protein [Lacinutrix sp. Bg11-31]AUC83351.1 3-deoxy-D-manno-octulosonic acid transferase [Lacinutrix sp. Bg11-31]
MNLLYSFGILIADFLLKIIANFNTKIKLGVQGRAQTFNKLKATIATDDKTLWFHCASLGEYEQGLPVFTELRKDYPKHKIVLSFFSPSGYEIRKNTPFADVVVYLPLDSKTNAKHFLDIVNPELTIFVKYEIWPNLLNELKRRQLKAVLISAVFRENQSFFKWYGKHTKEALFAFEHIFTQNETSKKLLEKIGYNNITVSGDTRFDRVSNQLKQDNTLGFVSEFKGDHLCVVIGSSWPDDEKLIVNYINTEANKHLKFIIAPHNIKTTQIEALKRSISKDCVLFSEKEGKKLNNYQVLILDTIGLLTKVYNYADIAYVGGAMGTTGLHNTLEAAVFGVPIIIGKNHIKFPEAQTMINNVGMASISNEKELTTALNLFVENKAQRTKYGENNFNYINKNKGAVVQILDFLRI